MRPLYFFLAASLLATPPAWAGRTAHHAYGQPAAHASHAPLATHWYCRRCRTHADHGGRCIDCGGLLVRYAGQTPAPYHWNSFGNGHPFYCGRCRHWFDHTGRCPDCGGQLLKRERLVRAAPVLPRAPRQAQRVPAYHCSRCAATAEGPGRCHDCGALLVRYHVWARDHRAGIHPSQPAHGPEAVPAHGTGAAQPSETAPHRADGEATPSIQPSHP
jgi:hypothetical protein